MEQTEFSRMVVRLPPTQRELHSSDWIISEGLQGCWILDYESLWPVVKCIAIALRVSKRSAFVATTSCCVRSDETPTIVRRFFASEDDTDGRDVKHYLEPI